MSKPQRVLHIVASTMRAGVEVMLMNLYREIDRDKLQFDFIVHNIGEDDFGEEIAQMGGRVFRVPLLSKIGISKFVNGVNEIIVKNGPYIAVHAHTDYQGGFSAMAAKRAGVPIRVCHAHTDTRSIRSMSLFAKRILGRMVIRCYATQLCACSKNTGVALFGKRALRRGKIKIIYNSIDLSGFGSYDIRVKEKLLSDCNAEADSRLIGFVGRLNPVKNPLFFVDIAAKSKEKGYNDRFVFVGTGEMLEEIKQKVYEADLKDIVCFLGTRDDVPALMQCFSAIIIPSLSEGFPLVTTEAQAAGTPVLAAKCVTADADMGLNLLHFMSLDAGAEAWLNKANMLVDTINRPDATTRIDALKSRGFDAKTNVNSMLNLYGFGALK